MAGDHDAMDRFCGSTFWNDSYFDTSRLPNVSPCFQATVLVWTPAAFFWLMAPVLAFQLRLMQRKKTFAPLPFSPLLVLNLVLTIIAFVTSVLLIVKYFLTSAPEQGAAFFWYPLIRALTMAGIFLGQLGAQRAGLVSSGIIFNTFLLHVICSLPELYSWIERMGESHEQFTKLFDAWRCALFLIWFMAISGQTLALCFANRRSAEEVARREANVSPELDSSFLNRISLWWFNNVPIMGSRKNLEVEDLFELNRENRSEYLTALWERFWTPKLEAYNAKVREMMDEGTATSLLGDKSKTNGFSFDSMNNGKDHSAHSKTNVSSKDKPKIAKPSVVFNLFQMFKWQLISAGAIKSVADVLQFANPYLLQQLLVFVSNSEAHLWQGISYALLMFFASELRSLMVNYYFYIMFRMGAKIQVALTSAVYKKASGKRMDTLRLSNAARRDRTVGEIVNVMAIDVERFQMITSQIQQYWSSPLQISLALAFLFNTLGVAAIPGVFIMIIFIPMSLGASVFTRRYQMKQMKLKDERTKLINEILNGIKVVKLYAWEQPLWDSVEKIRKQELRCNVISNAIRSLLDIYNFSTPFLVALFSFMTYTMINGEKSLTPQTAFVSLTLFNQLRSPMTMVGLLINMTVQAIVSNRRIKDLLVADEIDPNAVQKDAQKETSVKVEGGDFAWEAAASHSDATLQDVNLEVRTGSLIAIVGRVGAGKSSLLSALLGEMSKLRGYVGMHGQVAYVPQQPWIQNMSLRNNVTFGRPFNRSFYQKVIDMCALKSDLAMFPQGDAVEIGEKGINLSGGQKARVSLARAVYQNADLYLFDDPLSAVDSHVGKHIFDKVIGPKGILRNKTRLLVTHGVTFLKDVDLIVHIDDGRILEMGSYAELMVKDEKFADLIAEAERGHDSSSTNSTSAAFETAEQSARTGDDEFEEYDDTNIPLAESGDVESPLSVTRKMSTVSSLARRSCSIRRTVTPPCSPSKSCEKSEGERTDAEKLIQSEAIQTGRVKSAVYVVYMRAASYFLSIMFAVLYMAYTGFQLGRNIWLSEWSDANDPAKSSGDNVPLATRLSLYAGLGVAETLSFAFALVCLIFGSLRASKGLHGPMLERILHAPMAFFDTTPIGRILNRFGKDVDVVDTMLPMNFRYFMMCLTQVASTILIVCISTPVFIVVAVILVGIYVYALKFYVPTSRQLRRLESNFRSPIYSHFSESIQGASTIRAFQKMDDFVLLSNERVDRFIRVKYLSLIANRWLGIRLELLGNLVTFFAALFAALSNEFGFVASAGLVGLSVSYAMNITETMNFAVRQVSELETNIVSVERLKEYSEVDSEAPWVIEGKRPSSGWPAKGGVVLENYATRYRPGLDLVVKNISADVPPAQKIGIVGRTGAGKSSLTLALFRIIEAAEGKIVIDGVDIATIGLHDLRSGITIIPQEPVLFSGTLRFNLDPFERYSDDQIWQALEMAHLKDFVSSLADGLTHKITEGGDNISVGQRQLVCLARALLRRSKILVLDEATAAVDVSTDALIQETIRRQFADSTVLTIAHRLNTILDYDKVMVLDSGVIREFASPQELLQDSNSAFYAMVADAKLSGNSS